MRDMGLATRQPNRLRLNPSRVVSRLFVPGQELVGGSESRASSTVERVLALSETEVEGELAELLTRFEHRHQNLTEVFDAHADRVIDYVADAVSLNRRRLLGAAFTHEYAIEGAAICNPSLVVHPNQSGMGEDELRVVLSYRAIGEGHRSSIVFRTGAIDATGQLTINDAHPFPVVATTSSSPLRRTSFHALLRDVGNDGETAATVLDSLDETFDFSDLMAAIAKLESQSDTRLNVSEVARLLHLFAASFYRAQFEDTIDLSRRVLWPTAPNESSGMEDARFVRFEGDGDGEVIYYATYTAFDGLSVTQQLLETKDFIAFVSSPLAGHAAQNKGLAIFPRKVNGQYVALSRHDRESNAVAFSTDVHEWEDTVTAHRPRLPWEILQLGNCGSPIELEEGWLVIYHGVGPMRTYGIGALLLDHDDPSKVIAQLPRPLLIPADDEQDGYVPNVVYSCGSLVHRGVLYMPYGIADQSIGFATFKVEDLLAAFEPAVEHAEVAF